MTRPATRDLAALPPDTAAAVRQLAEQLHEALRAEMTREEPPAEVTLLWQAAKMINGAAGGLDNGGSIPPADQHFVQWADVAVMASDIADTALEIAATGMSPTEAAARQDKTDVDALEWPDAAAYAATVEVTLPDPDREGRTVTVSIAGDTGGRTLTVATDHGREPRPHTAASRLRVAHNLHRLGAALGDVVDVER